MGFEWDGAKNAANLAKHGIDFDNAVRILDGPVFGEIDRRRDHCEERIAAVGIANGLDLFVVHTVRKGNRRIIPATVGK